MRNRHRKHKSGTAHGYAACGKKEIGPIATGNAPASVNADEKRHIQVI
jgi:hypothetical protein